MLCINLLPSELCLHVHVHSMIKALPMYVLTNHITWMQWLVQCPMIAMEWLMIFADCKSVLTTCTCVRMVLANPYVKHLGQTVTKKR